MLNLSKVSLPADRITRDLKVDETNRKLHPVNKISSVFRDALVDEHIHILVQSPPRAVHEHFLYLS